MAAVAVVEAVPQGEAEADRHRLPLAVGEVEALLLPLPHAAATRSVAT